MKTNRQVSCARLLTVSMLCITSFFGCAPGEGDRAEEPERSASFAADATTACPEGRIPWKFPAKRSTNSEDYIVSEDVEDGGNSKLRGFSEIAIQSVSCANATLYSETVIEDMQERCDGQRTCDVTALCKTSACESGQGAPGCAYSDATVTYTCAVDGGSASAPKTAMVESSGTFFTKNSLSCQGVGEDLTVANEKAGQTVCVPAECHGRARRNADMECVVDASKVEVVVELEVGEITHGTETMDSYGKAIMRRKEREAAQNGTGASFPFLMTEDATLDIPITVKFANDLVPDEVTFTAWIEDSYDQAEYYGLESKHFRCIAFGFTIKKDDPHTTVPGLLTGPTRVYRKTIRKTLPESCDGRESVSFFNNVMKEGGYPTWVTRRADRFQQKLHFSYDMEGRSVWHKDVDVLNASTAGDSEPECTPNPVDMFVEDRGTWKHTNKYAYYMQRLLHTYKGPNNAGIAVTQEFSDRAEVGTIDIVARNSPTLRVFSSRKSKILVDLTWYVRNLYDAHLLNWERFKGGLRDVGKGPAPKLHKMRADVFIVPVVRSKGEREAIEPLLLGSIPLTDGSMDGKFEGANDGFTQSAAVPIEATAKQKLVNDPTSIYYISGKSRAFDLFYCINATDGLLRRDAFVPVWGQGSYWYRNELRFLSTPIPNRNGQGVYSSIASYDLAVDLWRKSQGQQVPSAHEDGPFDAVWSVELENSDMHRPYAVPFKYRGCRTAAAPVVFNVDRFKPAIPVTERVTADIPAGARTHTDFNDTRKSGDSDMSGTQENGSEETCPNNDSSDVYCSNTSANGGRSEGEGGGPLLDMTATIERDPPEGGKQYPEASLKFRGQMAGFAALDLSNLAGSFLEGNTGQSRKLTFAIAPNWATIVNGINRAKPSPTTKAIQKTFYGKQKGLGFAVGVIIRTTIVGVPVAVTFQVSVGAAVGIQIDLEFAPPPGKEYACLGETEDCIKTFTEAKTFDQASKACVAAGGSLSEMKTTSEFTKLDGALSTAGITSSWVGAQLAYELYTKATEYRWLSNDTAFASNVNGGGVVYKDNVAAPKSGLAPLGSTPGGIIYDRGAGALGSRAISTQLPYACTLPPADKEHYYAWSITRGNTLGAGVLLEGCTPNERVGFCLGASLNVIAASISPKLGQTFRWLYANGETKPTSRNGELKFSIPFKLSLFSGSLYAALRLTLDFVVWNLKWTIHSFNGITLAKFNLFELTFPVLEDY